MDEVDVFIAVDDADVRDAITQELTSSGVDAIVTERRGLDGATAQWVVGALVAMGGIRPLLDFLLHYKELDRVGSITVGDVTIIRPRPKDVDRLLERQTSKPPAD